ncbi:hypothetical protein EMVG_00172 [Emiliania huxleyi virus PS401]|nr:hypothetical protein EMVG_00172 [Emiliania huxleyi virus PS401]
MTQPMTGGDESLKMASVNSVFTADSVNRRQMPLSASHLDRSRGAVGAFLGGMLLLWLVCFVVALAIMFYGSKFMVEHYGVKGNMSIGVYLAYFFLAPVWWVALMIAGFQRVFGGKKAKTVSKSGSMPMPMPMLRRPRRMPRRRRRNRTR